MKRVSFRIISFNLVALSMIVMFQNCSPVGFQNSPEAAKNDTSGTPDANEQPIEPSQPQVCKDTQGQTRSEGETWQTHSDTENLVTCPDASSRVQVIRTTLTMMCEKSHVKQVGEASEPVTAVGDCPAPSLVASAVPATPAEGSTFNLQINSQYVSSVSYSCSAAGSTAPVHQGAASVGAASVPLFINSDLSCDVTATNSIGQTISAHVDVPVDCGNKMKVGGRCEEFACKEVRTLTAQNGILDVPARTTAGVCYSVKLMSAIPLGNSNLTPTLDDTVVSRNHDAGNVSADDTRHPYVLGRSIFDMRLAGARQVKLSGAGDRLAPIRVDNFVLSGTYPKSSGGGVQYYRAFGSSDSTVGTTGGVLLQSQVVPFVPFATGGTSTLAPLDISSQVNKNEVYTLDVRALDCGGSRELTEIYLLFQ